MQVSNAFAFPLLNLFVLADYSDQECKRHGAQQSEFDLSFVWSSTVVNHDFLFTHTIYHIVIVDGLDVTWCYYPT